MQLNDFLELAVDNIFEIGIYDLVTEQYIFDGTDVNDIPDKILELEVCSWELGDNKIVLNVEQN